MLAMSCRGAETSPDVGNDADETAAFAGLAKMITAATFAATHVNIWMFLMP